MSKKIKPKKNKSKKIKKNEKLGKNEFAETARQRLSNTVQDSTVAKLKKIRFSDDF